MRASQYNKLRVASGLEPVDFGTDGYMVWTLDTNLTKYWQDSLANNPELTIEGHKLHAVGGTLDIAQTQGGPALCQQLELWLLLIKFPFKHRFDQLLYLR